MGSSSLRALVSSIFGLDGGQQILLVCRAFPRGPSATSMYYTVCLFYSSLHNCSFLDVQYVNNTVYMFTFDVKIFVSVYFHFVNQVGNNTSTHIEILHVCHLAPDCVELLLGPTHMVTVLKQHTNKTYERDKFGAGLTVQK